MAIVVFHFTQHLHTDWHENSVTQLISRSYLAVDLFFIMSGCVLAHVYGGWFRLRVGPATTLAFLRARFARVYPLHLATLIMILIIQLWLTFAAYLRQGGDAMPAWPDVLNLADMIKNLLLVHGLWNDGLSWNFPSWSISTEFFAYLTFPLAAPLLLRLRILPALALMAALYAGLAWLALAEGSLHITSGPSFLRCITQFMMGVLLYRLFQEGLLSSWLSRDGTFLAAAVVAVVVLHRGGPDILAVLAFLVLVLAGIQNDGRVRRALHLRPLVWLGDISYSIYMTHAVILGLARVIIGSLFGVSSLESLPAGTSALILAVMVLAVLALSQTTYRRIELPARRSRNRHEVSVMRKPARRSSTSASTSG
jgi:peptidoglycan/LPS O-acetylase OafA/YrhL